MRLQLMATMLAAVLVLCVQQQVFAVAQYDEAVHGDLSNDRLNPTVLSLSEGVNSLRATTGFAATEDQEYFTIAMPAGGKLEQLKISDYQGDNYIAFMGLQAGQTFTFAPEEAYDKVGELLGWAHFGVSLNTDLLPEVGQGFGAIGFSGPLTGSHYTFWVQQFDLPVNYQMEFVVSAVPEPSTSMLIIAGVATALTGRRRRRASATNCHGVC
jgi:hypothetical protein